MAETPASSLVLYQTEDGQTRLQVRLEQDTVWLTQKMMAELFEKDVRTINEHIQNIFDEGELRRDATIRNFRIVQPEGGRQVSRDVEHYNLDVIISVGYRVRNHRGTQFRIWATQRLRDYIVKGFAMDDDRLKQSGGGNYFDELLERIRDIRSSEKLFWRKVLEIYATSVDYDPRVEASKRFFATVQNKMHWAAHGQTAAEVISARADAAKPHMGLTGWQGTRPLKGDVAIAKNYLSKDELETLNLLVSAYLDFAELQARSKRTMTMQDWIAKLDDFTRLTDRQVLTHAGTITADEALASAQAEFERFRTIEVEKPSPVELHFMEAVEQVKKLEKGRRGKKKP